MIDGEIEITQPKQSDGYSAHAYAQQQVIGAEAILTPATTIARLKVQFVINDADKSLGGAA